MEVLRAEQLSKTYHGVPAVTDVSFSLPQGSFFAFLGPNGAGKTTTLQILLGLTHPDGGRVTFFETPKTGAEPEVRRKLGVMFQEVTLDDHLTAFENLWIHGLAYGLKRKALKARIEQVLHFVQLAERSSVKVRTFSGGMKRRLEMARALLHRPSILFLDEPTVGLDPQTRYRFWELARAMQKEGLTIFLTTHYLEEAEAADHVVILDHGKVIASGSPQELKEKQSAESLNDLFLELTGTDLRDEDANVLRAFLEKEGRRFT